MQILKYITTSFLVLFFLSGCCAYKIIPGGDFHCAQIEFDTLVKEKNYKEAFSQINPEGIENSQYSYKIQYDILNVLVNGRSVKKEDLVTYKAFLKFPDSYSWSMLSAKVLVNYLETGNIDNDAIKELTRFLQNYNKDKLFWADAIKDIKK